ncbi:hypothetical protein [Bradyrhizobium sp. CB3481]|uniref:hypothetical protein n=1 Tax=Bradyrhizobium sp. CB3481 TaxID=3039158 RepID=UPI0024B13456|nr:hypothetical protein [Bradyrhizobium sp. CB3481]WFU14396.1 hypothetical protein QA643_24750 [Bradyrhizobium sp. CB3481]
MATVGGRISRILKLNVLSGRKVRAVNYPGLREIGRSSVSWSACVPIRNLPARLIGKQSRGVLAMIGGVPIRALATRRQTKLNDLADRCPT